MHIHYVVQPVTMAQMTAFGVHGPKLQVEMFTAGVMPDAKEIEVAAARARLLFVD